MTKVSMVTRNEIIHRYVAKYSKASKKDKGEILDSICSTTGISRSRLIHVFAQNRLEPKQQKRRGGRKRKYGPEVVAALTKTWAYMDFASGKRLKAGMKDLIEALVQFGEINYSDEILAKLHQISAATMDRLLKHEKEKMKFRGISTTKPGTLLKRDIPMRLGTQWDDAKVGFVEIDLVAHCGETTAGEYVNTLDVTDVRTGWTETAAVINKAQKHVFKALLDIRERLPFPLLGIDSDNGSEFINHELYRYCSQENICFTRSRPYKKNDGCHIEQKNWSIVRRNIGYERYEGGKAVQLLNEYYSLLRLHTNFFMPSVKLLSKRREGAKIIKHYDKPTTPYRRLLVSKDISQTAKNKLREQYKKLNPAQLKRDMINVLSKLGKYKLIQQH